MSTQSWKLTDQEISECQLMGGSIGKLQEAKRQAYLNSGGVILNPEALDDLYEACNRALTIIESNLGDTHPLAVEKLREALAKVEKEELSCREHWVKTVLGEEV